MRPRSLTPTSSSEDDWSDLENHNPASSPFIIERPVIVLDSEDGSDDGDGESSTSSSTYDFYPEDPDDREIVRGRNEAMEGVEGGSEPMSPRGEAFDVVSLGGSEEESDVEVVVRESDSSANRKGKGKEKAIEQGERSANVVGNGEGSATAMAPGNAWEDIEMADAARKEGTTYEEQLALLEDANVLREERMNESCERMRAKRIWESDAMSVDTNALIQPNPTGGSPSQTQSRGKGERLGEFVPIREEDQDTNRRLPYPRANVHSYTTTKNSDAPNQSQLDALYSQARQRMMQAREDLGVNHIPLPPFPPFPASSEQGNTSQADQASSTADNIANQQPEKGSTYLSKIAPPTILSQETPTADRREEEPQARRLRLVQEHVARNQRITALRLQQAEGTSQFAAQNKSQNTAVLNGEVCFGDDFSTAISSANPGIQGSDMFRVALPPVQRRSSGSNDVSPSVPYEFTSCPDTICTSSQQIMNGGPARFAYEAPFSHPPRVEIPSAPCDNEALKDYRMMQTELGEHQRRKSELIGQQNTADEAMPGPPAQPLPGELRSACHPYQTPLPNLPPPRGRHALQDYQMQLMLLEQQKKKMKMIRQPTTVEEAATRDTGESQLGSPHKKAALSPPIESFHPSACPQEGAGTQTTSEPQLQSPKGDVMSNSSASIVPPVLKPSGFFTSAPSTDSVTSGNRGPPNILPPPQFHNLPLGPPLPPPPYPPIKFLDNRFHQQQARMTAQSQQNQAQRAAHIQQHQMAAQAQNHQAHMATQATCRARDNMLTNMAAYMNRPTPWMAPFPPMSSTPTALTNNGYFADRSSYCPPVPPMDMRTPATATELLPVNQSTSEPRFHSLNKSILEDFPSKSQEEESRRQELRQKQNPEPDSLLHKAPRPSSIDLRPVSVPEGSFDHSPSTFSVRARNFPSGATAESIARRVYSVGRQSIQCCLLPQNPNCSTVSAILRFLSKEAACYAVTYFNGFTLDGQVLNFNHLPTPPPPSPNLPKNLPETFVLPAAQDLEDVTGRVSGQRRNATSRAYWGFLVGSFPAGTWLPQIVDFIPSISERPLSNSYLISGPMDSQVEANLIFETKEAAEKVSKHFNEKVVNGKTLRVGEISPYPGVSNAPRSRPLHHMRIDELPPAPSSGVRETLDQNEKERSNSITAAVQEVNGNASDKTTGAATSILNTDIAPNISKPCLKTTDHHVVVEGLTPETNLLEFKAFVTSTQKPNENRPFGSLNPRILRDEPIERVRLVVNESEAADMLAKDLDGKIWNGNKLSVHHSCTPPFSSPILPLLQPASFMSGQKARPAGEPSRFRFPGCPPRRNESDTSSNSSTSSESVDRSIFSCISNGTITTFQVIAQNLPWGTGCPDIERMVLPIINQIPLEVNKEGFGLDAIFKMTFPTFEIADKIVKHFNGKEGTITSKDSSITPPVIDFRHGEKRTRLIKSMSFFPRKPYLEGNKVPARTANVDPYPRPPPPPPPAQTAPLAPSNPPRLQGPHNPPNPSAIPTGPSPLGLKPQAKFPNFPPVEITQRVWVKTITSPEGETFTMMSTDPDAEFRHAVEIETKTVKKGSEITTTTTTCLIPLDRGMGKGVMRGRETRESSVESEAMSLVDD